MHKREDFHHTDEQVSDALLRALTIADNVHLTDEDRAAVLPVLVTLLSSKQVFYEQVAPIPDLAGMRRGQ